MPRPADPGNERAQRATRESRARAASVGRPEASFVDGAISAAVFLFAQAADAGKADKLVKELLSELAAAILATHPSKNFDLAESRRKIAARLAFRKVDDHKRFVAAGRRVKRKAPAA